MRPERAYGALARRGHIVVLRALLKDELEIPSIATSRVLDEIVSDATPSLDLELALDERSRRGPEKVSPLRPPHLCVALSASTTECENDEESSWIASRTREHRVRDEMSPAPTMSPRDACMRVLARRCALQIMRIAIVLLALFAAHDASAHSLDIGYLRIDQNRVVLDLDRAAAAQMLDAPDATPEQLRARASELAAKTYARELPAGCTVTAPAMEITGVTVRLTTMMSCPEAERTWRFPFVTDTHVSATFELLVKDVASDRMTVVDRTNPMVTFGAPSTKRDEHAAASVPRRGAQGRSMFLIGGLLVGVMLAPLARFAIRK